MNLISSFLSDYETAESRGFAFVRFYDVRDAEDAMMALNGRKFDGRPLRIQFARYGRVGSPSDRLGGGRGGEVCSLF